MAPTFFELNHPQSSMFYASKLAACDAVSFRASKLKFTRLLWLNYRWFIEEGIDIGSPEIESCIRDWLIDEFGYIVPEAADLDGVYIDRSRCFLADRYGDTNLVSNGGSGRSGIAGDFNVKGIGVTPLVGQDADWLHSNGCLWVEEAVREAIFAEIACAEFPHSAIPVVAILDTGLCGRASGGGVSPRRALLIRPNVLRVGHLQRAALFRPLQARPDTQQLDAKRTKGMVRRAARFVGKESLADALDSCFTKMSEQIAFGHVHRLFHGDYFSSNLAFSGALLDFGSFRAVPHWCRSFVEGQENLPSFGEEFGILADTIRSIVFYANKYKKHSSRKLSHERLIRRSVEAYVRCFERECLRIWNLHDSVDSTAVKGVVGSVDGYFRIQQSKKICFGEGRGVQRVDWLYDRIDNFIDNYSDTTPEGKTLCEIQRFLGNVYGSSEKGVAHQRLSWLTARRLLRPRPLHSRESLRKYIVDVGIGLGGGAPPSEDLVCGAIRQAISIGRRHWPRLPSNLAVYAQVVGRATAALLCVRLDGVCLIWIEARIIESFVEFFGTRVPIHLLEEHRYARDDNIWLGMFDLDDAKSVGTSPLWIADGEIVLHIPPMDVWY